MHTNEALNFIQKYDVPYVVEGLINVEKDCQCVELGLKAMCYLIYKTVNLFRATM